MQLVCWDFKCEISLMHLEKFQSKSFSVSLSTEDSNSVLLAVMRAGSDLLKLPLLTTDEDKEEEVATASK